MSTFHMGDWFSPCDAIKRGAKAVFLYSAVTMLLVLVGALASQTPRSILPLHGLADVDEHASENVHTQRPTQVHRRRHSVSRKRTSHSAAALALVG